MIGAGDTLNAGIIYGLIKKGVTLDSIESLSENEWDEILGYGMKFAAHVCGSEENYITEEFAQGYKLEG